MKKKIIIGLSCVVVILLVLVAIFGISGLTKRSDIVLIDYDVSADNNTLKLNVAVTSSIGYVRDAKVELRGTNEYITFYNTFGGLNSKFGAKSEFEIEVTPNCDEIYFYHGDGGYTLALERNSETGNWEKVK